MPAVEKLAPLTVMVAPTDAAAAIGWSFISSLE